MVNLVVFVICIIGTNVCIQDGSYFSMAECVSENDMQDIFSLNNDHTTGKRKARRLMGKKAKEHVHYELQCRIEV